jgi:hypothetical protein
MYNGKECGGATIESQKRIEGILSPKRKRKLERSGRTHQSQILHDIGS